MTYEKIVETVRKAYEKTDFGGIGGHIAIEFDITGEGEGKFYLEIADGKANVQPYDYNDRDVLVTAGADEIIKFAQGKLAYGAASTYAVGDEEKLMLVINAKQVKKAAAKKAAAKKAPAKKAAPAKKTSKKAAKPVTVSKKDVVNAVAEKAGISKKEAAAAVDAYIAVVTEELASGEKVALAGFGTYEAALRPARTGRNPLTGETIQIAESKAPKFKAAKALKDAVN